MAQCSCCSSSNDSAAARSTPWSRSKASWGDAAGDPALVGRAISLGHLWRDQLGDLGRDVRHRLLGSAQAASRAEQGADVAEVFVRRLVHDGYEQVTR